MRADAFSLSAAEKIRTSSMSWIGSNPVIATIFIQSSPIFWASVPASLNSADSRIADTRMPITTLVSAGRKFSAESPAANRRAATRAIRTNLIDTSTPQYESRCAAPQIQTKVISPLCSLRFPLRSLRLCFESHALKSDILESEYVLLTPPLRASLPGCLPRALRRTGPHPKCLRPPRCQPQRIVARHCRSLRIRLLRLSPPTPGRRRLRRQQEATIQKRPHRIRFRYRRPPSGPRRLEHPAPRAHALRRHGLVRTRFRFRRPAGPPHLRLVRRGQLSRHGIPQRCQGGRARGWFHALPVRNHGRCPPEGQRPGGQGGRPA